MLYVTSLIFLSLITSDKERNQLINRLGVSNKRKNEKIPLQDSVLMKKNATLLFILI